MLDALLHTSHVTFIVIQLTDISPIAAMFGVSIPYFMET